MFTNNNKNLSDTNVNATQSNVSYTMNTQLNSVGFSKKSHQF